MYMSPTLQKDKKFLCIYILDAFTRYFCPSKCNVFYGSALSCDNFYALEDPVPPWVGYNEETEMKSQILALSTVSLENTHKLVCK